MWFDRCKRFAARLWPVAAIAGCLIFFYREFIAGKVFGWEDDLYLFFPYANYFATSIKDGVFPFWLPGLRCGMPFYSDVQAGVFYPLKWLLVLFVKDGVLSQQAYQCYLVFQYFLGGSLFYILMRKHRCCQISALVGALVYCFSGFNALHIQFFSSVEVMIWFPLLLLAIRHYFEDKQFARIILISGAVFLTFIPGFPQITLYISYFAIAYWFVLAIYEAKDNQLGWGKGAFHLLKEVAVALGAFLLAILMGAIVFIPAFENWKLSSRVSYGYGKMADTSMPFYYIVHMFFPNFTGVPNAVEETAEYWGFNRDTIGFRYNALCWWHYWDLSCYAGQVGIIALLYSLINIRTVAKSALRLVCVIGAVLAFWFMLGRYGGLFRILYDFLPGISAFRGPGRMSCLFNASQSILAAFFVSDLIRGKNLRSIRNLMSVVLGFYIIFFIVFLILGPQVCDAFASEKVFTYSVHQTLVGILFCVLIAIVSFLLGRKSLGKNRWGVLGVLLISIFVDLWLAHGQFHKGKIKAADYFVDKDHIVSQLQAFQKKNGLCRFAQVKQGKISELVVLPRNTGFFHEVECPEGYVLFNLSSIKRVRENASYETLCDLLNIGMIAKRRSLETISIRVRERIMPRAMFFSNVRTFESKDELLARLAAKNIDHWREVAVVEDDVSGINFAKYNDSAGKRCRVKKINNNEWIIDAESDGRVGIIFVSQAYYPGWKAVNDNGQKFKVVETFGGLSGIVIQEPFAGEIRFYFSPRIFKLSAAVSIATLLAVVGALAIVNCLKRHRR